MRPGIGAHDIQHDTYAKFKHKQPIFGFGTSKRPDVSGKKVFSPGPGAYQAQSFMGNVPAYVGIRMQEGFKSV